MHILYCCQLGVTLVQLIRCDTLSQVWLEQTPPGLDKAIGAFHWHWYNPRSYPKVSNKQIGPPLLFSSTTFIYGQRPILLQPT